MVYCLKDNRHFCARHQTVWHYNYTCEEYDATLVTVQNEAQRQREAYRASGLENQRRRQEITDSEAADTRRRSEQKRVEQERTLAEERARQEEEQRRAEEVMQRQAQLKREEEATHRLIFQTTRPCPRCRVPIEKIGGCDQMYCTTLTV
ncbi:hypothetical protein F5Y05DRAFT_413704 [Hypoxylon sp. FL0543]|nr:hypothetical protein F5Y05DRAFT_413704 [Hypoxylon sp. FL0543]